MTAARRPKISLVAQIAPSNFQIVARLVAPDVSEVIRPAFVIAGMPIYLLDQPGIYCVVGITGHVGVSSYGRGPIVGVASLKHEQSSYVRVAEDGGAELVDVMTAWPFLFGENEILPAVQGPAPEVAITQALGVTHHE